MDWDFTELIANEFDELVELHFFVITTPWAVGNVKSFQMFRDELELRQCYRPECMHGKQLRSWQKSTPGSPQHPYTRTDAKGTLKENGNYSAKQTTQKLVTEKPCILVDSTVATLIHHETSGTTSRCQLPIEIIEISKVSVASLTYPKMLEFLNNANSRVLVIPPLNDGSPRRGCEDPHCPSVRVEVTPIIPTVRVPQYGTFPPR
ncbi:hypothetical protein T06_13253 [Trichinella sp. T6]|nr:hypothetical protein T06_13253 [Trichinella sp. T6]